MTRYVNDDDASAALHMDVVHEVDDDSGPSSISRWAEAMRRLNSIPDQLARKVVALHQDCGGGCGPCDGESGATVVGDRWAWWGCETLELVADHHGVAYPPQSLT